jgi:WD40 repeat protein
MPVYKPNLRQCLLSTVWAVGVVAVFSMMPVGPREGWQPPPGEWVCGLLRDGHTMATVRWTRRVSATRGEESEFYGPVRFWDIDTGELLRSLLPPGEVFTSANIYPGHDLLRVARRGSASGPESYSVRLYDAVSGEELVRLTEAGPARAHHWEFSTNGRIAAAVGVDEQKRKIITVHDFETGRRLQTFLDCDMIRLSPDGRRVAGRRGSEYLVFDTISGKQIASLGKHVDNRLMPRMLQEFAPDGRWVLDDSGQIWDIDHNSLAFKIRPNCIYYSSAFAPDSRTLITVGGTAKESWLAFYDLPTGQEETGRRIPLMSFPAGLGNCPIHFLRRASGKPRLIFVEVTPERIWSTKTWDWLSKIPGTERLFKRQSDHANIVVDTDTGRELMRDYIVTRFWSLTPDLRFALRYNYAAQSIELWDIPPRKPLRWLLLAVAVWTVCLAGITWLLRRQRRRRLAISNSVTMPASATS